MELARRDGVLGSISADISTGAQLVLGNELLHGRNPDYPCSKGGKGSRLQLPGDRRRPYPSTRRSTLGRQPILDTLAVFAGYLVLDAVIANQDRHHENWAVLSDDEADRLAPSFDHGSSLGFNLTDADRQDRCETNDRKRRVEAWARRAKCRPMENGPGLVDLALEALWPLPPEAVEYHHDQLKALDDAIVQGLIQRISPTRLSHPSRIFVERVVAENRKRLLDGIDRAR